MADDEHIEWLMENTEPEQELIERWKASHFSRENMVVENKKSSLLPYYMKFPIMKHDSSYKLVCNIKHFYVSSSTGILFNSNQNFKNVPPYHFYYNMRMPLTGSRQSKYI